MSKIARETAKKIIEFFQTEPESLPGSIRSDYDEVEKFVDEAIREAQLLCGPVSDIHCEHNWIDAGEQVVENAKFCTLCHAVRSS